MEKISKKSIESLHHFKCVYCEKWWTIGDAPNDKDNFYCPWCGKENKFEKRYGNKEKLFVYGTLTDSKIQKKILGRIIKTTPDILLGYEKSEIEIEEEKYPLIVPNPLGKVGGSVIEVSKDEFRKIDEYETDVYKREMIVLESGSLAWVYLKRKKYYEK